MHRGSGVIQGYFPHGLRQLELRLGMAPRHGHAGTVQRHVAGPQAGLPIPGGSALALPPHMANFQQGSRQPLPPQALQRIESHFGAKFGDVRINVGPAAGSIGAIAFTHGSDIHFGPGQYDLQSVHGRRLLAHELTHVVQQRTGRVRNPFGNGVAVVHDAALEAEAERMAHRATLVQPMMASRALRAPRGGTIIQRKTYRNTNANQNYVILEGTGSRGRSKIALARADAPSIELAYLEYEYITPPPQNLSEPPSACIQHVEAYGMPGGTGAGYFLVWLFASKALAASQIVTTIGTGVDQASVTRNLQSARSTNNADALAESLRNQAAVHIYSSLGFDTSNAVNLSRSYVATRDVFTRSFNKIKDRWLPVAEPVAPSSSSCFLTTACVTARGLADDCEELTTLRDFRDCYVATVDGGAELVEQYYAIAPDIVRGIDARPDRLLVLDAIYGIVRECIDAIAARDHDAALRRYRAMVLGLSRPTEAVRHSSFSIFN